MKTLSLLLLAFCLPISAQTVNLDGATGHVYSFNAEAKSFELLKATEYDPKTEQGRSRFTVHWTEKTRVRKISDRHSFAGLGPRLFVTLDGIDARNAKALAEGKPFVARLATVYRGVEAPPAGEGGQQRISGWLEPDPGKASAGGTILIKGKPVKVTLRSNLAIIAVHEEGNPADLAKGFWQATIHGAEGDGKFTVNSMEITPLEDPLATDDPKLPRVLIIGDSISMNYIDAVKEELKGVANVHRNVGNAGPSAQGVLNMELWLGNYTEKGRHWDVIQFNHGLHDLKQAYDKQTDTFGAYSIPPEDYKANLEKEIAILKKTGAKLIWCSTTPVPNDNKSQYARKKGASEIYNKAAMEVMAKHPEIRINDLHAAVTDSPVFDNWRKTIDVHFYKEEECRALGKAVADAVRAALAEQVHSPAPVTN